MLTSFIVVPLKVLLEAMSMMFLLLFWRALHLHSSCSFQDSSLPENTVTSNMCTHTCTLLVGL